MQANVIVTQLVGHEYCFKHTIPYLDLKTGECQQKTLSGVFENLIEDIIQRVTKNPFLSMHSSFAEREVFALDKYYIANCRALRGLILKIV